VGEKVLVSQETNKRERRERERERERDFMAILDGLHHGITTILAAAY
jgi:hypothetical protein